MEDIFPNAATTHSLQPQVHQRTPQLASSPPNATNILFTQNTWTDIEPTLLSPENANVPSPQTHQTQPQSPQQPQLQPMVIQNSPPTQQVKPTSTATLQAIAPAPPIVTTTASVLGATNTNTTFQKNLFVNVQQQGALGNGNNVVTSTGTTQIINPFANVFINQHGTVVAAATGLDQRGSGQGTLIPTSAFGGGQGGNANVFPVILPSLLTVVDGNGAAKLPLKKLATNNTSAAHEGGFFEFSLPSFHAKEIDIQNQCFFQAPTSRRQRRHQHPHLDREQRKSVALPRQWTFWARQQITVARHTTR